MVFWCCNCCILCILHLGFGYHHHQMAKQQSGFVYLNSNMDLALMEYNTLKMCVN